MHVFDRQLPIRTLVVPLQCDVRPDTQTSERLVRPEPFCESQKLSCRPTGVKYKYLKIHPHHARTWIIIHSTKNSILKQLISGQQGRPRPNLWRLSNTWKLWRRHRRLEVPWPVHSNQASLLRSSTQGSFSGLLSVSVSSFCNI